MQQTEIKPASSIDFRYEQNSNMHAVTIYYSKSDNTQGKFSISYLANAPLKDFVNDLALGKASLTIPKAESFFNVIPWFSDESSNNTSAV